MKTQVLYVVISSFEDVYLEQAYISMLSLRHQMHQDVHITLLMDSMTQQTLVGFRKKEAEIADEIVVKDIDNNASSHIRSRLLKTNARNIIEGDYLYIDTDTIIKKSLEFIDAIKTDIAAVVDTHMPFNKEHLFWDYNTRFCHKIQFPEIEQESTFFNSGVIWVRDTPATRRFYDLWHKNYIQGVKEGVLQDQPSFAQTNYQLNHIVQVLPPTMNCQFKYGIRYLNDAIIVHYLTTNYSTDVQAPFMLNDRNVFELIKKKQNVGDDIQILFDDIFTGIPEVVLLTTKGDIDFIQSNFYKKVKSIYITDVFSTKCIKLFLIIRQKFLNFLTLKHKLYICKNS